MYSRGNKYFIPYKPLSILAPADQLDQGRKTHFHRGPHVCYGGPQRASFN